MNVLITGATKGIGRALVDQFAAEGAQLAICARTTQDLDALAQNLRAAYPSTPLLTATVDVTDREQVLAFAERVEAHWERIDVLINNAGAFVPGSVTDEPDGQLERMLAVNLYSAYHLTRALLPRMRRQGQGHIFNLCSIANLGPFPAGGSYSVAKFALHGFTQNLREDLKTDGIKVTAILPGATWSASWEGVELPESRLLQASDIARLVWQATQLSPQAVVEDIVVRPQLGDL